MLACYAVIERDGGLDDLAPWPHWRGALPSDEKRADFVAPTSETHPFRRGEFMRRIRLHGDLDAMEVGTVMAEVARYNGVLRDADDDGRVGEALSLDEVVARLCESEVLIAPGGVEVEVEGALVFWPQCCAGLERWREWIDFAEGSAPPWGGHGKEPVIERLPSGKLRIGLEGGACAEVEAVTLREALRVVERDLAGFAERVARWAEEVVPAQSKALTAVIVRDFALVTNAV